MKHKYTQEEVLMAVGSEIEYTIPPQIWNSYIKPGFISQGILLVAPAIHYPGAFVEFGAQIVVYDASQTGSVTAPYSGIIRIPFIDAIKNTKLYKMVRK